MPEERYPTAEEFWKGLDKRGLEPDLREELARRAGRSTGEISRVGRKPTVIAVIERLMPGSHVPTVVLGLFVDASFERPMGRGDERQGVMARSEHLPAGFRALDLAAGGDFSSLPVPEQDGLLQKAERGELAGPPGFASDIWFKRLRDLVLLGFGSDPRGMIQMGYPGPPYKPGHLWLDSSGVKARLARRPGYLEL
jgi:hypothetical protein